MIEGYIQDVCGALQQVSARPFIYKKDGYFYEGKDAYSLEDIHLLNTARLKFIIKNSPVLRSIIDIGFGRGDFLKKAVHTIDFCYGYDIIPDILVPDGVIHCNNPHDYIFDVATFWDSLEHIKSAQDFLRKLQVKYIFITVPYCHWQSDNDDNWLIEEYAHLKPDEHIWHFNPDSLEQLMWSCGYRSAIKNSLFENKIRDRKVNYKGAAVQNVFSAVYRKI